MAYTSTEIKAAIDALRKSYNPGSVTPNMEAEILESILGYAEQLDTTARSDMRLAITSVTGTLGDDSFYFDFKNVAGGTPPRITIMPASDRRYGLMSSDHFSLLNNANSSGGVLKLDSTGHVAKDRLPKLTADDIPTDLAAAEVVFRDMFNVAVTETAPDGQTRKHYDTTMADSSGWYANGYHSDGPYSESRYFMNGRWYNYENARMIFGDRWLLGVQGLDITARTNIPAALANASVERTIDLSCCATYNYRPIAIALGREGWDSVVYPSSLFRAFNGAINLTQVIGVIDCKNLTQQSDVNFAFASASKLTRFCLRNIPEAIKKLDLTGCGGDYPSDGDISETTPATILDAFPRQLNINGTLRECDSTSGTDYYISAARYLAANANADNVRTTPLGVKVAPGVFDKIKESYDSNTFGGSEWNKALNDSNCNVVFYKTFIVDGATEFMQVPESRTMDPSIYDEIYRQNATALNSDEITELNNIETISNTDE